MAKTLRKITLSGRAKWLVKPRKHRDIVDQLLVNRGVDLAQKQAFLEADFNTGLFDPYLLPDMDKAVKRIIRAVETGEKVGIFADYDADGTPGAALLYKTFTKIGLRSEVFIPTREDGYGLSQKGIDHLVGKGCRVIVTVDLGIRNETEAVYCQNQKVDLIITDHHLIGDEIPRAFAVINPKLVNSKYPFPDLCGCGVAYKLVWALSKHYPKISESFLKWNLDLAAISTISDVVPLISENRVIAKYGLCVLRKTRNKGLRHLYRFAGIDPAAINTYAVGFQIGPRINTPGRIDRATKSFDLLVSDESAQLISLAGWLNAKNVERQRAMEKLYAEAEAIIEEEDLSKKKIIVVDGDWNKGILGPPASQLAEKYHRPVILFARAGEEYHGSARSISGVNIIDILEKVGHLTLKFGGHAGAAGITVAKSGYRRFCDGVALVSDQAISESKLVPSMGIDCELSADEMTPDTVNKIAQMEPFGLGNPKPMFALMGVLIKNPRFVGNDRQHFSALVEKGKFSFKAIIFNCQIEESIIQSNILYDIIFYLEIDSWNGHNRVSLNVVDLREHRE
ncbi:MAG: single-stranded-DNA-specific exonuclease RecJ [Patescibacteria group bacterium]